MAQRQGRTFNAQRTLRHVAAQHLGDFQVDQVRHAHRFAFVHKPVSKSAARPRVEEKLYGRRGIENH